MSWVLIPFKCIFILSLSFFRFLLILFSVPLFNSWYVCVWFHLSLLKSCVILFSVLLRKSYKSCCISLSTFCVCCDSWMNCVCVCVCVCAARARARARSLNYKNLRIFTTHPNCSQFAQILMLLLKNRLSDKYVFHSPDVLPVCVCLPGLSLILTTEGHWYSKQNYQFTVHVQWSVGGMAQLSERWSRQLLNFPRPAPDR